jgi:pimeloyl-ACP methyl ester carboxylesterase
MHGDPVDGDAQAEVAGAREHSRALRAAVAEAFRTLPARYLGAAPGFDATYHVRLGDIGQTYEVRCTETVARVAKGTSRRAPDVVIAADASTWLRLRAGELSGLDAFRERTLSASGRVDVALAFEGLFRLPNGRDPILRVYDVEVPGRRISTLTLGEGPDVVLLHGLGSAKTSFFDTAAALRHSGYRVHAIDLPGFGSSCGPTTAPYDAAWFADTVVAWMDAVGLEHAHLVGNSLGGRVALEVGLRAPERVGGLVLLCPAVSFVKRRMHPVVRVLRPEFGLLPHRIARPLVARQLFSMFADADALDPSVAEIAVDEFQRTYSSAGARLAFLRAARAIYLDKPYGRGGFYPRLSRLRPPAVFVWGTHDPLIPASFSRHVHQWLPSAEQVTFEACGHVPQIERPEDTIALITAHLRGIDASVAAPAIRLVA